MSTFVSKCSKSTPEQFQMLLDYMKSNGDLSNKDVRCWSSIQVHRKQWQELMSKLNSIGPGKTLKQWFKVWADWKSKVKTRVRLYNSNKAPKFLRDVDMELAKFMDLKIAGYNVPGKFVDPDDGNKKDRRFKTALNVGPKAKKRRDTPYMKERKAKVAKRSREIYNTEKEKHGLDKKVQIAKRKCHDLKKKQANITEDRMEIREKRMVLEEKIVDIEEQIITEQEKSLRAAADLIQLLNVMINYL